MGKFAEYVKSSRFVLTMSEGMINTLISIHSNKGSSSLLYNLISLEALNRRGLVETYPSYATRFHHKVQITNAGELLMLLLEEAGYEDASKALNVGIELTEVADES